MVRCQFVRGRGFNSTLIAWMSSGLYSHVDVILPDGNLLGSRSDRIGDVPPGVRIRPPAYETWKYRVILQLETTEQQERDFYAFLDEEIGKPYDGIAILSFAINRRWRDDGAWFCSELVSAALEHAHICAKLFAPTCKVTPVCLSTVMSALGAKVTFRT